MYNKAMTKPVNITAIEEATHTTWTEWLAFLESINAEQLPHKEIAQQVYEKLKSTQKNGGWWAQGITVAYEQYIGRRQPGQRSDGTYEVSINKTLPGTMDNVMQAWVHFVGDRKEFNDILIAKPPTTSATDKRHHWGCSLADGSRVNVDVYQKSSEKTNFTITHTKLSNQENAERWRVYWKTFIHNF